MYDRYGRKSFGSSPSLHSLFARSVYGCVPRKLRECTPWAFWRVDSPAHTASCFMCHKSPRLITITNTPCVRRTTSHGQLLVTRSHGMDAFHIRGGTPLCGRVAISGAKNAALPILAASILASEPVHLSGVPQLTDVDTLSLLLGQLGVEVAYRGGGEVDIATVDDSPTRAAGYLLRRMRAGFCVLGPLLARRGRAVVPLPGGCYIGARPVDLHLRGLAALGADLRVERGRVIAKAKRLQGARIDLSGPRGPTVTGTANILSAATLAAGTTVIDGAAVEPEIVDLGRFLNTLGARIEGLGTPRIEITGMSSLGGGRHRIIADRIEAGTLLIATAIARGRATVAGLDAAHLDAVLAALDQAGCELEIGPGSVTIALCHRPRPMNLTAAPYPGLPTDLQSQFMALLCLADGRSMVADDVFPDRFRHVAQLRRLGARIVRRGNTALVTGVESLSGGQCTACDLRASAALVLAGLAGRGETVVRRAEHLDRGYEQLEVKLRQLGADIVRVQSELTVQRFRTDQGSEPRMNADQRG